jgi:3-oxoacyl-[acyl-carrier protein] reductase
MILQNKNAVIYGAGGSLGGAVAKAFAVAGARVFLTGRRLETVGKTAADIRAATGGAGVMTDEVDAFDEEAIRAHLDKVVREAGTVDISFNAVAVEVIQNRPMADIPAGDFMRPVTGMLHTRFLTAMAAARIMMTQQSGVILSLTATPAGIGYPYTGGFGPANSAIETLSRHLGAELGIYGIRVVNIRSGGSPDSAVFKNAIESDPAGMAVILKEMEGDTMLKQLPLMADIANAAVFVCSDLAGKITGVTVDVTSGTTGGLNYKVRAR